MTFLQIWIGYSICGAVVFSLVFIWAVHARQFTDQQRAAGLSLVADELHDDPEFDHQSPSWIDRYTWVGLLLINFIIIGAVLILSCFRR